MPFTLATLVYTVPVVDPQTVADMLAAVSGVDLDFTGIEQVTGATQDTDDTTTAGSDVIRTITFNLTPAFKANFPDGTDQACPFVDLYTHTLAGALTSDVVAAAPALS